MKGVTWLLGIVFIAYLRSCEDWMLAAGYSYWRMLPLVLLLKKKKQQKTVSIIREITWLRY